MKEKLYRFWRQFRKLLPFHFKELVYFENQKAWGVRRRFFWVYLYKDFSVNGNQHWWRAGNDWFQNGDCLTTKERAQVFIDPYYDKTVISPGKAVNDMDSLELTKAIGEGK